MILEIEKELKKESFEVFEKEIEAELFHEDWDVNDFDFDSEIIPSVLPTVSQEN